MSVQLTKNSAGVLVATSLGAFGPLFSSEYVYDATSLEAKLEDLGVTFPNNQLRQGMRRKLHVNAADCTDSVCSLAN